MPILMDSEAMPILMLRVAMMIVETGKRVCYNEQVGFPAGFAVQSAIGYAKGSTTYGSVQEML